MRICFWSGIAVLSLVELALIEFNHNVFAYDVYILAVSVIIIIVSIILKTVNTPVGFCTSGPPGKNQFPRASLRLIAGAGPVDPGVRTR